MKTLLLHLVAPEEYGMSHSHFHEDTGFRLFDRLSPEEQEKVANEYFKFTVVRHPLDRLRSAYGDKIAVNGKPGPLTKSNYMPQIKEYLRAKGHVTNTTFVLQNYLERKPLSLEQFFDLIQNQSGFRNQHWETYMTICNPCVMKYDLIMKLETISDDIEELYSYLRSVNSSVHLPNMVHVHSRIHEMDIDKLRLVSDLTRKIDPEIMRGIMKIYAKDLLWAGYGWNKRQGAVCAVGDKGCC
jgi:hypothetical protein